MISGVCQVKQGERRSRTSGCMPQIINAESIATAVALAIIFACVKLFRDVDQLKTKTEPLLDWWRQTSMDALKIATNPTSERLTELADRYIANFKGEREKPPLNAREKQELIDGLREVMNDPEQFAHKRQSASISLRFIEQCEGMTAKAASNSETNH